jgi:transcriptional regulator with XRE-family HTH domain
MVKVSVRARKFNALLAANNMSQRRLASIAGFAPAYVSQILTGTRHASANARGRLLEVINKLQKAKGQHEYTFDDLFVIER